MSLLISFRGARRRQILLPSKMRGAMRGAIHFEILVWSGQSGAPRSGQGLRPFPPLPRPPSPPSPSFLFVLWAGYQGGTSLFVLWAGNYGLPFLFVLWAGGQGGCRCLCCGQGVRGALLVCVVGGGSWAFLFV